MEGGERENGYLYSEPSITEGGGGVEIYSISNLKLLFTRGGGGENPAKLSLPILKR